MTDESDLEQREETPWFLYLIECEGASIYTGITIDVARRYAAHVSGRGAKYTRARKPMQLLGWLEFPNKSEALKAEIRIKRLTAAQKRALVGELRSEPAQQKTPA
ncbi:MULTISPECIES: GIY-YIG nuclease family protein [unclassified Cupriavidus]|uniref:GIY-YIG nuclease family protein n=1 Tax=unclassified Cupriavidus TaxID=2640874 RepID=UPI0010F7CB94|nr:MULTISPECIES: GIY-YIG nuclease family protein [unclassified Cupriavidus]MWL90683.1 GIY-YIG nuclease family protein [Cupriavidus sp. SW-Y-13]